MFQCHIKSNITQFKHKVIKKLNLNSIYSDTCSNCPYESPTNDPSDHYEALYDLLDCESDDASREIAKTLPHSALEARRDHPSFRNQTLVKLPCPRPPHSWCA